MKHLLALAAVSVLLTGATAFAGCPCQAPHVVQSAPNRVAYVQPIQVMPVATPCCNKAVKKGFFNNMWTNTRSMYDRTVGSFFGSIVGY